MPTATVPRTFCRTVIIDGLRIFYREAGPPDAPTVLLLHGFPSSSHMFRELIPRLAGDFRVVAPDYPGFGHSDAPPVDQFAYTFDHLADVVEHFVVQQALAPLSLYMQDYGGPVGMRLATRHPEWVEALVVQNANLYAEGVQPLFRELLGPLWERRTGATEAPVLKLFAPEGTRFQYVTGARAPEALDPDAWTADQAGLDRPGNAAIQLDLQADYHTNLAQYPTWRRYLVEHQPPALVVWGTGDPLFGVAGVERLRADLRDCEVHLLDTGHFALEEDVELIAERMRAFLSPRVSPRLGERRG